MGRYFTRADFRSETEWKSWQRDCRAVWDRAAIQRYLKRARINELKLKHDTSLVGMVIVIPREFVSLRWKKSDFSHLLEAA